MPGISGVDLASCALELRPSLNVLFVSGYAPDPRHRALFANRGVAFLQKPFTPQALAAKSAALCNEGGKDLPAPREQSPNWLIVTSD
jgi:FixJ family two-component response regulator